MSKFEDLTPSTAKAYKRHLQIVDKLFKRGQETGKVDPGANLYADLSKEPDNTYASPIWIGTRKKDKSISLNTYYLKDKHQDWVSKHEVGHILAGHCAPYSRSGTDYLKDIGDWETTTRQEIEATIAGFGGPSRIPIETMKIMKDYVEDLGIPADQSWPVVKTLFREYKVPYKLLNKAEDKFGFKD